MSSPTAEVTTASGVGCGSATTCATAAVPPVPPVPAPSHPAAFSDGGSQVDLFAGEIPPHCQVQTSSRMRAAVSAPLKVLVVDDDPATLRFIAKVISAAGYQVLEARDGREALGCVLADCPDMLVTDWDMPDFDGPQLCRMLREENLPFHVHILLLTAKSSSEEMIAGLDAGADDFVSKPVNPAVLLARLKAGARTVAMERRLRDIAGIDPLTGVMNRREFHARFSLEWDRATRYGHSLSCVMIDLDFFKQINDTHGHAAGDLVLQAIVRTLQDICRSSDRLARYGGEELCVLLTETDEAGAVAWAERARTAIAKARIPFSDEMLCVTGSLGVAALMPDISGPEALVALADQALSVAKESGRNRVVAFSTLADASPDFPGQAAVYEPMAGILARDVMAPAVYAPHQNTTLGRVAEMFLQLRLNAAPVVDDQSRLVGIVSENDILAVAASNPCLNIPVHACMKTHVVHYDEETPAKDVYRFLARASVPRVVVVNKGCPTGVISRATLLRWLRNWSDVHRPSESAPATVRYAGIRKAADMASDRLAVLCSHLASRDTDVVTCAVAEATRLEGFAHDILAHCRGQDSL